MTIRTQVAIGWSRAIGEHHVKPVQDQVRQQVVEFVDMNQNTQVRVAHCRLHQGPDHRLWHAVRHADRQTHSGRYVCIPNRANQCLAQLKYFFGLLHRHAAHLGQDHSTAGRLQQRHAERALKLVNLRADGLYRHAKPLCRACHAAFLGDDQEVVKVALVELQSHVLLFPM